MHATDKVVGYLPRGADNREQTKRGRVIVKGTKQEMSFRKIGDSHSSFSKFCKLAATDSFVRLLLFAKPTLQFIPSADYPLSISYPLFLTKDDAFLKGESLSEESQVMKNLATKKESADRLAKDSSSRVLLRYVRMLFEDQSFRNSIMSGKPPKGDEADRLMSDLLREHEDDSREIANDIIDFMKANFDLAEMDPLFAALSSVDDALHNHSVLASVGPIWEKEEITSDAIARIEGLREIRTSFCSVCLECRFRNGLDTSTMIEMNPRSPRVRTFCKKCSGETILSRIELDIPSDMIQVFHENRIQEFALAYTIAQSSLIERIFVHKKICPIIDGNEQKGREVDILAITKDNRMIAMEVTTTHRASRVPEKAAKKTSILEALPVDLLFYISADPTMIDPEEPSESTVVLGARHIASLVEQVESFL